MKVSVDKAHKGQRIIVYATDDADRISEMQQLLGKGFDVRSLSDIGCDLSNPIKGKLDKHTAIADAKYVKKYYGFDVISYGLFGSDTDEQVFAVIEGNYDAQEYQSHTFSDISQVQRYLTSDTSK